MIDGPPLEKFVLGTVRLGPLVWAGGSALGITAKKPLIMATLLGAIVVAPLMPALAGGDPSVLVVRELAVGMTLAFVARTAYVAVEWAGEHVGRELGLGEAETLFGESGGAGGIGGILVTFTALAALLLAGGDTLLIRLVARSYELVPPGSTAPGNFGAAFAIVLDGAGRAAFVAAAPSIGLSVAIMISLGLVGRAAPQINAYVASYPLRIAGGLCLLLIAVPVMVRPLLAFLDKTPELMLRAVAP